MFPIVLSSPGSIFLKLGPLTVRWYGVMIALGFVTAVYFATKLVKAQKEDSEKFVNCALIGFLGGIIGARLYFVCLNLDSYLSRPEEIFATWLGGMSIHGGIVGGFLFGLLYAHFVKAPKLLYVDIFGACIPIAQSIGRFGNFFNSEAFGLPVPSEFPLAVLIPLSSRPHQYMSSSLFHATFLYESLWNFGVFLLLYLNFRKLRQVPGLCCSTFLGLYSIGRLAIEPLRTDSIMAGAVPVPIVASLITLLGALVATLYFCRRAKKIAAPVDSQLSP